MSRSGYYAWLNRSEAHSLREEREHRVVPNRLNREFRQSEPGKVVVTDITYLPIASGENVYLSYVKDVATREIVAHKLSTDLRMDLVFQTMKKLEEHLQGNRHPEAMIHSDQGFHYTHSDYQRLVGDLGLAQSMSRRATVSTTHQSNRSSVI